MEKYDAKHQNDSSFDMAKGETGTTTSGSYMYFVGNRWKSSHCIRSTIQRENRYLSIEF